MLRLTPDIPLNLVLYQWQIQRGIQGCNGTPFASPMHDIGQFLDQKEAWWPYIRGTVCAPNYLRTPLSEILDLPLYILETAA